MKPLHAEGRPTNAATTGIAFLDRFANRMETLATDLERSVTHMQQRINTQVQVSLWRASRLHSLCEASKWGRLSHLPSH